LDNWSRAAIENLHNPAEFYAKHYDVLVRHPLVADRRIYLADPAVENCSGRRCRFCGRSEPDATFRNGAHAVPEFLGNRTIFSLNECDECNAFLAREYEDHLAKWSLFQRSLAQVPGKKGKPTYKGNKGGLRVSSGQAGVEVFVGDLSLSLEFMEREAPFEFSLPSGSNSPPFIPMRAAMALTKIACSVCSFEELSNCQGAIDWLMQRTVCSWSYLPILFAFTPGPINDQVSEVRVLRRKSDLAAPYLWFIVQFRNFRLQTFVPFSPADSSWFSQETEITVPVPHYPSQFGSDWPFGKTKYRRMDWSSSEAIQTSAEASIMVLRVDSFTKGQGAEGG
jgi:hypothetical protein